MEVLMIISKSADGTAIASERSGDGPPLVIVAGAFTTRTGFAPLGALLAPHFTVFEYDRRGRGDSGDTPPYAAEREIEDLGVVIEEAGGSAYVFGHSSGATLALDAASTGMKITKLALYEPPFLVDDSRVPPPDDLAEQLARLVAQDRRDDAVALWMTITVQETPESMAQWRGTPPWQAMESLVHTAVYDATIMAGRMSGEPLSARRYANATMPTLVAAGELSPPGLRHAAEALADLLPAARRHTFPGTGHDAPPEQVAPVLTEFFS
jgi:pimeloyl-ACP methyl ester carboxylesterase